MLLFFMACEKLVTKKSSMSNKFFRTKFSEQVACYSITHRQSLWESYIHFFSVFQLITDFIYISDYAKKNPYSSGISKW